MKSNIIRYLLGGLIAFWCIASNANTMAYTMRDLVSDFNAWWSSVHEFNFYTNGWSLWLQYYDKNTYWAIWTNFSSYWVSLDYMANVRSSRMMWWQHYYSWSDIVSAEYVSYPLVGFVDNWNWWITFKYFVNWDDPYFEDFNVVSRAWFLHTFSDWYSCLMDKVYFNAWSFIFMCSDSLRTYQVLAWWYTLWNHILYLDPYNSTNNVWWIARAENKAWSTTLIKQDLSEILYWDVEINQSLLESIFSTWFFSYTVSAWWSNVFPTCGLMACSSQSRVYWDVWFVYTKDLTTVDPDFGWWSNVDSNSWVVIPWSVSNSQLQEQISACIDEYTLVKDTSAFWYRCREDFSKWLLTDNQYYHIEDYLLSWDWIIFDSDYHTDNCANAGRLKWKMADLYPLRFNTDIHLAYNASSSTDWINISYLCWVRSYPDSSSDWVSTWQNLLNIFWVWNNAVWSWTVIDSVIMSAMDLISSPIQEYIIDPISSEYYSWYALVNKLTCSTSNNTFEYWDYILYFWVVVILFVLYRYFL